MISTRDLNEKLKLVIVSDWIRRDLHEPLRHFERLEITHLYRQEGYQDMRADDYQQAESVRWQSGWDLWRKLARLQPDIVQGAEPWANRASFVIALVTLIYRLTHRRVRLVWPSFENRPMEMKFRLPRRWLVNWLARLYGQIADGVIYLNLGARRNLLKAGVPEQKLIDLLWGTWGIDCDEFAPQSRRQKTEDRRQKRLVVAFAGRVSKAKGVPWLLAAWPEIKRAFPSAELVIGGPCDDDQLKAQIKAVGATWTGGPIKNQDLPEFFRQADVVVAPSITTPTWEEQVGMINLQAMACGVPVVSTQSGAIPEYVRDGEGVMLVPEQNGPALAEAVVHSLRRADRQKFGLIGRQFICQRYEVKANIKKIETYLLMLLERR